MKIDHLRFPVGNYEPNKKPDSALLSSWINTLAQFPDQIKQLTENLSEQELSLTYRPEGWNIKQVVHHCADSHMNALMRFKLALTEEGPNIRPYEEAKWAELIDGTSNDIATSLSLIKGIHYKLVMLISHLSAKDLECTYFHPEHQKEFNLAETVGNYAWHSAHHLAHVENALKFRGVFP